MIIRAAACQSPDQRDATDAQQPGSVVLPSETSIPDEEPVLGLLREDVDDAEVNAWADDAAGRILEKMRKTHGLPLPERHSRAATPRG